MKRMKRYFPLRFCRVGPPFKFNEEVNDESKGQRTSINTKLKKKK